uniref:Uncharacterized protein n=1 Tax=Setaria digitata TaxID=48799 RepID=A0A915Q1X5_9BILA
MLELKKWVEVQAGASFSVIPFAGMLKSREMGKFRKQISCNSSFALSKRGAFTMAQKINLANRNISSCVCFNTDDKHLIAAEAGGQLCIIKTDRRVRYSFRAHQGDVTAVGCSKVNPHIFYTAGSDGLWKIWDDRSISNSAPTAGFATYTYSIAYIDADSYDSYVVTTSTCGTRVEVWDLRRFSERVPSLCDSIHFKCQVSFILESSMSNLSTECKRIFDIMTGEVKKFQKEGVTIYDSSWNPNECEIACATLLGTVMTYYHGDEQE